MDELERTKKAMSEALEPIKLYAATIDSQSSLIEYYEWQLNEYRNRIRQLIDERRDNVQHEA